MDGFCAQGIVIKRKEFGEADRILTIYTQEYGKITVLARGIRRLKSKRSGCLELFCLNKMFVVRGRGFDILTEVESVRGFTEFRKNLDKVGRIYYICELVDKLTREEQENREVFDLMVKSFELFEKIDGDGVRLDKIISRFEKALLVKLGFLPKERELGENAMRNYIESIIESKLKSRKVLSTV